MAANTDQLLADGNLLVPASVPPNSARNFQCTMCKFTTRYKTNLVTHMRRHLGDAGRIYKCPHCPYSTASNSDLNRHKKIRHLSQEDVTNGFKCGLCPFSSTCQSNLRKHFLKKHARRPSTRVAKSYGPVAPVAVSSVNVRTNYSQVQHMQTLADSTIPLQSAASMISGVDLSCAGVVKQESDMASSPEGGDEEEVNGDIANSDGVSVSDIQSSGSVTPPVDMQRATPDVLRNSRPAASISMDSSFVSPDVNSTDFSRRSLSINFLQERDNRQQSEDYPAVSPVHSLLGKLRGKYQKSYGSRSSRMGQLGDLPSSSVVPESIVSTNVGSDRLFECAHCSIYFAECAMYLMHRSLHNMEDPLKCNLCGHHATDKYNFVAHYLNHR